MATEPITDHDRIRRWAEARRARPARVIVSGGQSDPALLRFDFPGVRSTETVQAISWAQWFKAFDEHRLALLVEPEGTQRSKIHKLVSRDTVQAR